MPALAPEPYIFPEHLLGNDGSSNSIAGEWWVLQTKPRSEKSLARRLLGHGVSFFLPLFLHSRRLNSRVRHVQRPLFPGYIFLHGNSEARLVALETDLVVRSLPVIDSVGLRADLVNVLQMMQTGAALHPESRLAPGTPVEIVDGPLSGMTGKLLRRGKRLRFIVEVRLLQCGVSVELEHWMFRPVP